MFDYRRRVLIMDPWELEGEDQPEVAIHSMGMDQVKPSNEQPADLLRWLNARRRCTLELVNGSTLQGSNCMG